MYNPFDKGWLGVFQPGTLRPEPLNHGLNRISYYFGMFNKKKQRDIVKKNICITLLPRSISVLPRLFSGKIRIPANQLSTFVILGFG
jgi:hypothetical protein